MDANRRGSNGLMGHGRAMLAVGIIVAIVGVPARYAVARYTYLRNFNVVDDGALYRSGQLTPAALDRLIHDYRIAAVVNFRAPDANDSDAWEEAFCAKNGVRHFRVKPAGWAGAGGRPAPAQRAVDEFLAIVTDPANQPVLVHCLRGVHRTGAFCAVYRMERQGWTSAEAIAEMRALSGAAPDHDDDVAAFLRQYTPAAKRPLHP